jgi:hypothetical protein
MLLVDEKPGALGHEVLTQLAPAILPCAEQRAHGKPRQLYDATILFQPQFRSTGLPTYRCVPRYREARGDARRSGRSRHRHSSPLLCRRAVQVICQL